MSPTSDITLTITELGQQGNGIGYHEEAKVIVPFTLPGDKVQAQCGKQHKHHIQATCTEVLEPSKYRQSPICSHFTQCGGCQLQHLNSDYYQEYKIQQLSRLLEHHNLPTDTLSFCSIPSHSRRRAQFKIHRRKKKISIGFMAMQSHRIIPLQECPVTTPAIMKALPKLKETLQNFTENIPESVSITLLDKGLDILFYGTDLPSYSETELLIKLGSELNLCRMNWKTPDTLIPILSLSPAITTFSNTPITLPSEYFLQATQEGEKILQEETLKGLASCQHVLDLYAGCGTYTLPLIESGKYVTSVEGSEVMTQTLQAALHAHQHHKGTVICRDIHQYPLIPKELKPYDGVVINPPRNGALRQIEKLAEAKTPLIVMVSCNPRTFARDGAHLQSEGYQLNQVTAVDQFLWSTHLEVISIWQC